VGVPWACVVGVPWACVMGVPWACVVGVPWVCVVGWGAFCLGEDLRNHERLGLGSGYVVLTNAEDP
jgi:hypothetical protein